MYDKLHFCVFCVFFVVLCGITITQKTQRIHKVSQSLNKIILIKVQFVAYPIKLILRKIIFFFSVTFFSVTVFAQKDSINVKNVPVKGNINIDNASYNPLSPSKAAFYSAIFPGMGQVYNKKYWKVPIVWGALGTSIYFYLDNNKEFKRYRRAFKLRKAGFQDEFTLDNGSVLISEDGLVTAQKQLRENRDLSLLVTVVIYVLQIVETSVNAHLLQFNTDDNLSFKPTIISDPIQFDALVVGLTIKYSF